MSVDRFYDTYAILERYTVVTDDYGAEIKTWTVSTTVYGVKQNKSGDQSITNNIEKDRTNDRFYCDSLIITKSDRLLFSTKSYSFQDSVATSSNLTSTNYGALYYCDGDFSSYVYGDYARYSSVSSAYVIEEFDYYRILNVYDLIGRHMQIDLEEDNKNRI